ncbi:mCG145512, partial [Mus musculus]
PMEIQHRELPGKNMKCIKRCSQDQQSHARCRPLIGKERSFMWAKGYEERSPQKRHSSAGANAVHIPQGSHTERITVLEIPCKPNRRDGCLSQDLPEPGAQLSTLG